MKKHLDFKTRFFIFKKGLKVKDYELFHILDKSETKDKDVHVFPDYNSFKFYIKINTNTPVSQSVLGQSVLRVAKDGSIIVTKKDCDTLIKRFNVDKGIEPGTPAFQELIDKQKERIKRLGLIPRKDWILMNLNFHHWD